MYNFSKVEKKWQKYWEENKTFKTDVWDFSKPKFYCLDMFPYPSGQGLHVGHPEGYTATDVLSRMKKMQGYNVLHPMGFDSFGLPAEQYAVNTGNHPGKFTEENIANFTRQLKMIGLGYDWDRVISTADPGFYKWTQWIFKELCKDGLAECKYMPVNWCEELGTVLANDEVIDGKSERGGFPVVKKNMRQWIIKITDYADRLLSGLDEIDFPESTKEIQRNWIGKSIGASINFKVKDTNHEFEVFTTRADTLFGATYCVMAPEHKLVLEITTAEQRKNVEEYQALCASKSDLERTDLNKDKTGVFTGAYAINPVNNTLIPIWISDYVLASYGTGAIMAVPAHDERDYEFARKFEIPIIPVIEGGNIDVEAYTGDGVHINSGFLNGLAKEEAIEKMIEWLETNKCGTKKINYRLRDWIFARQRYWGEPLPVINYDDGTIGILDDEDLPLVLPEMDNYKGQNGNPPLDNAIEWKNVTYKGKKGVRETTTMPGSAGSSWYFLRYIDPFNEEKIGEPELLKHWMPVDLYMGGSEHAVGHLLYSRMWNQYLYDKGISPVAEPFKELRHQGMILGTNGEKMSKSRGNVINPDDVVNEYGSDVLRTYLMFMGPIEASKPWNENGLDAAKKFLDRFYRIFEDGKVTTEETNALEKIYNQTVKKVTDDYNSMNINTAISQMMIFINAVYKENKINVEYAKGLVKLLNPVAPHITEEVWHELLNQTEDLATSTWPTYDENKLENETYEMVVQINGKVRGKIEVSSNTSEDEMLEIAKTIENVKNYLADATIVKVITVPKKLINIVIK